MKGRLVILMVLVALTAPAAAQADFGWLRSYSAFPPGLPQVAGLTYTVADAALDPATGDLLILARHGQYHAYGTPYPIYLIRVGADGTLKNYKQVTTTGGTENQFEITVDGDADPAHERIWVKTGSSFNGDTRIVGYDGAFDPIGDLTTFYPEIGALPGLIFAIAVDEGPTDSSADDAIYVETELAHNPNEDEIVVTRVSTDTGAVVWSRVGTQLYNAIVLPDGRLFGLALVNNNVRGFRSIDRTGATAPGPAFAEIYQRGLSLADGLMPNGDLFADARGVLVQMPMAGGDPVRQWGYAAGSAPMPPERTIGDNCTLDAFDGVVPVVSGNELLSVSRLRVDVFGDGGEQRWCVRSDPPDAQIAVTPLTAVSGQPVTLDPSASVPDRSFAFGHQPDVLERYEWDLDGDGRYETVRADATPVVTSFSGEGVRSVGLRVTDHYGNSAARRAELVVASRPPAADLTWAPEPPRAGQTVVFDGTGSGGAPARYEWDLDGDGQYEADTAADPYARKRFTDPGRYTVGLRITTAAGVRDASRATVVVAPATTPPAPTPAGLQALDAAAGQAATVGALDTTAPKLTLATKLTIDAKRRALVTLACPVQEETCSGTLSAGSTAARFKVGGGERVRVRVPLTATARRALAKHKRVKVALKLDVRDAAGNRRASRANATVRP
jgi:hypothetical protein